MSDGMQKVPEDHPLMLAWKAYQKTNDYRNTHEWAKIEQHTDGSLWAAFEQGWRAASLVAKRQEIQ